jgi:hypothetical protein
MGGAIWLLKGAAILPFVAEAVVAAAVYLGALLLMKTLSPEELSFAKRFLTLGNLRTAFIPNKETPS